MADFEHLLPLHVVVTDGITLAALIALQCARDSLSDLLYRDHCTAALGPHCRLFHGADIFDEEHPNRLTPRLCAEDIRKLQHGHIEIFARKAHGGVFLIYARADIGVIFCEFPFGVLFGKIRKVRTEDDAVFDPAFFGKFQKPLYGVDIVFFIQVVDR